MSGDTSQDAEGRTPEPEGTPEARYRVVGYVLYDPEAGVHALALMPVQVLPDVTLTEEVV